MHNIASRLNWTREKQIALISKRWKKKQKHIWTWSASEVDQVGLSHDSKHFKLRKYDKHFFYSFNIWNVQVHKQFMYKKSKNCP